MHGGKRLFAKSFNLCKAALDNSFEILPPLVAELAFLPGRVSYPVASYGLAALKLELMSGKKIITMIRLRWTLIFLEGGIDGYVEKLKEDLKNNQ